MNASRRDERLNIAMIGTRGVPAAYGGFETAVEEIGARLADRGHRLTVYCRTAAPFRTKEYRGMRLIHLPALHLKTAETLSNTALSVGHALFSRRTDAAFVFNCANAPFLPLLRARGIPTAVHVDGLEWKRSKWSGTGQRYYRFAEEFAVRWADALIADAQGIADYYTREFATRTELLTYGAKVLHNQPSDRLAALGLEPGRFHLVVARFEPENHVDMIVEGYHLSNAEHPLVVVGSAPYEAAYTRKIAQVAASDARIHLLGSLWDQETLDQLYSHSLTYAHGHSVGGTNPSLLRAMGGGTSVLAYDVEFNREVVGDDGCFFSTPQTVRRLFDDAEQRPSQLKEVGQRLQRRASEHYNWDDVASGYERLATKLAEGYSIHGRAVARLTPRHRHALQGID